MSTAKKEPGLAMLVIVLALICLVVAALLGLVNQVTAPAIKANNDKTIQDSLTVVLPADSYEEVEYTGGDVTLDTGTTVPVLAVYKAGDEGYVVETYRVTSQNGAVTERELISTDTYDAKAPEIYVGAQPRPTPTPAPTPTPTPIA